MNISHLIPAIVISACSIMAAAATISIDPANTFDTSTDFTSNFTNNGSAYAWSAIAGIGGGGGIATVEDAAAPTFQTNSSTQFQTDTQTVSAFFHFRDAGQAGAAASVRAGVGTVNGGASSGEFRGINFQIRNPGGGSNEFTARLRVRGTTVSTGLPTFTLTDDHWYRLDGGFTLAADGTSFVYDFAVYDYGTDGTSIEGTVISLNDVNVTSGFNGPFDPSNTRHLAFIGSTDANGYGFTGIDNIGTAVIPEPGTLALVGLALGALLIIRKHS